MADLTSTAVLRPAAALTCAFNGTSAALRAGARTFQYDGGATVLLRRLLPLLDGQRTLDSIVDAIGDRRLQEPVLALCERMLSDGLVFTVLDPGRETVAPELATVRGSDVHEPRLSAIRVVGSSDEVAAVTALAPAVWEVSSATLAQLRAAPDWDRTCAIVWLTDPNDDQVAEWNEHAYHHRLTWLPISRFDGEVAVIGPLVIPQETPCFECYRRRRASRSPLGDTFLTLRAVTDAPLSSKALVQVLGGLAVVLLQDWAVRSNPYLPGAVRTVTFKEGLQVGTEYVLRVPRCSACRPAASAARPTLWTEYFIPNEATE